MTPHLPMVGDVAAVFLVSRLIFYVTAALAFMTIPEYAGSLYMPWHAPAPALIDASWRWDSGWYAAIARNGYHLGAGQSDVAFFPLYPLLIRVALEPLPATWLYWVGVLISHVACFGALIAVWLYAERSGGRPVAQRATFLLAIFPTAFFFNAAYTEALFLLVTAVSLAALQRGRFVLAGATGFLASLTRVPGLYLALPYLITVWQRRAPTWRGRFRQLWPILLIPAGLGAFAVYLWLDLGAPLAFLETQDAWGHTRMLPWMAIYDALRLAAAGGPYDVAYAMGLVNTAAALFGIALGLILVRRDPAGAAYCLASILSALTFPIQGNPTISLARYVVVLFPLFVPLARWAARWPVLILLTSLFLPAQVILTALFVRWYWVI